MRVFPMTGLAVTRRSSVAGPAAVSSTAVAGTSTRARARGRSAWRGTGGAHPHPGFGWTVLAVITFVVSFLVVAIMLGADDDRYAEFREGHSVGVLAALLHGMTAALAWASLLAGWQQGRPRSTGLWALLSLGFLFFGLDEMLQFHERAGNALNDGVGGAPGFRNWNDVVVLLYGVAGVAFVVRFRREILRLPWFAEMLFLGFVFYGLSSGIDSVFAGGALKNVPDESAKLLAAAFFSLAGWAALLAIIAELSGERAAVGSAGAGNRQGRGNRPSARRRCAEALRSRVFAGRRRRVYGSGSSLSYRRSISRVEPSRPSSNFAACPANARTSRGLGMGSPLGLAPAAKPSSLSR